MQKTKQILQISLVFLMLLPLIPSNVFAEEFAKDLELLTESVYFSNQNPIVDSKIRIYANVRNNSKYDLSGTVKFYDEKMQIQVGLDQPISVLAGGSDDVFVDFQIKGYGDHPVAARVIPWETEGDNPANNKVTRNIFVDYDTDGDGIPNRLDNDDDNDGCTDENDALPYDASDCLDTDGDKIGNKLDPDDDNDELLDLEELEKGTNPVLYDTDGDGVNDKDDLFPLDSTRSKDFDGDGIADENDNDDDNDGCKDKDDAFQFDAKECLDTDQDLIGNNTDEDDDNDGLNDQEEIEKTGTDPLKYDTDEDGLNDKEDLFPLDPNETKDSDLDGLGDNADPNDANKGPSIILFNSVSVAKVGEIVNFDATASEDADGQIVTYEWNFGDGEKSEEAKTTHVFSAEGEYNVILKVVDDQGESREKIVPIKIIRDLSNLYLLLAGLAAILIMFLVGMLLKRREKKNEQE